MSQPMPLHPIIVWLVEDDSTYRESIVYVLNHTLDIRCNREFITFEAVQALVAGSTPWKAPDVILMDIKLPGEVDGIEGTSQLKKDMPDVPIVMLTNNDEDDTIFRALQAGASGYLLKDTPIEHIIMATREATRGGMLMPPRVAQKTLSYFQKNPPPTDAGYGLTNRELQVLQEMAQGHIHQTIADHLSISKHTVENHLRNIYRKLHVNSGVEAVAKVVRDGLI